MVQLLKPDIDEDRPVQIEAIYDPKYGRDVSGKLSQGQREKLVEILSTCIAA